MRKYINDALKILSKVLVEGAYSNMALNGERVSDMTTRLVYGTLENNVKIEYILSTLVSKKPQTAVYTLLKIGTYALLNLDDVPHFAIVSECVEVAKMNGKGGASGFVNAVLKKVANGAYELPKQGDGNYLSVTYSKPQWFVNKLLKQYGVDVATKVLSESSHTLEHVRVNSRLATQNDIEKLFAKSKTPYQKSEVGGYIVRVNDAVKRAFDKGLITYQSPSSMLAVKALQVSDNSQILDVCSAPGGKAIYMSELNPHGKITACDLHEHRVRLIQKYKNRMHTPNVRAQVADATVLNNEWIDCFDFVLCDAPCSCFGTFTKHPDVFLSKDEKDIYDIAKMQATILETCSKYLKKGGAMVYSTCTLFKEENQDIVNAFLAKHPDFYLEEINIDGICQNDGTLQILPHDYFDGFFIARLRREK